MRHDSGCLENGPQSLFKMARLVRLIANQHERMRPLVARLGWVSAKWRLRHGQLEVHVLDIFGDRRVVRHPHQIVGHNADFALEVLVRTPLSDEIADLAAQLEEKAQLPVYKLAIAPGA